MTTQPFEKKKLTLNKRTIVLLNENDMKMMEGGTGTTNKGDDISMGEPVTKCTGNNGKTIRRDGDSKCI